MVARKKGLKYSVQYDQADVKNKSEKLSFIIIEGTCKKCQIGPHSLVVTDFTPNRIDKSNGIIKTFCVACQDKGVHYLKNIEKASPDESDDEGDIKVSQTQPKIRRLPPGQSS